MEIMFAERLRALRSEKNMTQAQLAEALDTTQRKISYWESKKIEPDLTAIMKLCDYFCISSDYLLGRTDY